MVNYAAMAVLASLVHLAMAAVVWSTLVRQWHRQQLTLWVAGALCTGFCGSLLSLPGSTAAWPLEHLGFALIAPAFALRIAALRLDLSLPPRGQLLALLAVLQFTTYLVLRQLEQLLQLDALPHLLWSQLCGAGWAYTFAWHGAMIGRRLQSRSGWLLAAAEVAFGSVLLARAVAMLLGWAQRTTVSNDGYFLLIAAVGALSGLYGNLGYLGMVLDRTSATARRARDSQLEESLRREAAEQRSAELGQLLTERNQVLHLLAHEIRQPLHNASGALQAAVRELSGAAGSTAAPPNTAAASPHGAQPAGDVQLALQRAQGVLGRVHAVLDNTLAAAQLFARAAAPDKVDTDLDLLVHLTLGDLTSGDRARVQLEWQTSMHSMEMEPGLVRLALRNLLNNAFEHGGASVKVRLVVAEVAMPHALVLRVVDDGPTLPGDAWARLHAEAPDEGAEAGAPAHHAAATQGTTAEPAVAYAFRRGLGVAIARRVMGLHGGQLEMALALPQGVQASLVFPLPDDDMPR